jgi:hypothetical protein
MSVRLASKPFEEMPYANDGQGFRPGDWMIFTHADKCRDWDNCTGHLFVVLPNKVLFDLGARARNCTLKQDRLHRCWVLHGVGTPFVSSDKNGRTCGAGAGSIMCHELRNQEGQVTVPAWHGMLTNGEFR